MRNLFRLILTAVVLASCSSTPAASSGVDVKGVTGFDVTLVTFGSPRVYDASAAKDLDSLVKKSYRIQHHDDLVPRVPKLNYRHVGNLTRINDDGKEIRFSGILGTLERLWEVEKADLNFSALTDHPIRNYLPAIKNWYNRATLKG